MSVGSVSSVVSSASTEDSASILVARKALDVQQQQGDATVRLLEAAQLEPHKGNQIDVFV